MNSRDARETLNSARIAIDANVRAYMAGQIDRETFHARQAEAHHAIETAGQQSHFLRRWRADANHVGSSARAGVVLS